MITKMTKYKLSVKCLNCNKQFIRYISYHKHYKKCFCSPKCWYEYKKLLPFYKNFKVLKTLDSLFLSWLAGFFEGEGSIGTRNEKIRKNNVYITIPQNDVSILEHIKKQFKFGSIYKCEHASKLSKNPSYVWHVASYGLAIIFAYSVKNYIRSKIKKRKFYKWIKDNKFNKYFLFIKKELHD